MSATDKRKFRHARLRKKLAPTGVELVTLRGLGYLLKASASA